jgi:hypothetical protein
MQDKDTSWYNDVFGTGLNVFGAGSNINTDRYKQLGLLDQKDIDKAQRASLTKGAIGSLLGYFANPQDKGYGSVVPYIAKGLQAGVASAQSPYDSLKNKVAENKAIDTYESEIEQQRKIREFEANYGKPNEGGSYTPEKVVRKSRPDNMQAPSNIAPNFNVNSNPNGTIQTVRGRDLEQISPNYSFDQTRKGKTVNASYFDKNKYLLTALQNGTIDHDDYLKYSKLPDDIVLGKNDRLISGTDHSTLAEGMKDAEENPYAKSAFTKNEAMLNEVQDAWDTYQQHKESLKILDGNPEVFTGKLSKLKEDITDWVLNTNSNFSPEFKAQFQKTGLTKEALKNTQILNALQRRGVFRAIKELGIGARGIDTPAERDFLIKVLTGDSSMDIDSFRFLIRDNMAIQKQKINDFNDAEKDGRFKGFLNAGHGSYLSEGKYRLDSDVSEEDKAIINKYS